MARRRFFVDAVRGDFAELQGDAAEHLRRVLRAERGQCYEISDNRSVYLAEVDGFGKRKVSFHILQELPAESPRARLFLLASLVKFDRFEWILEKATELGVERIVPVEAERSEKGLARAAVKRTERWRRILVESSQQARRARLPELSAPLPFAVAAGTHGTYHFFLEEHSSAPPILRVLPESTARSAEDTVCLLVGPEGGWTGAERATVLESGWQPVSLGPQILRAETAAIAALAILGNAWWASDARANYNASR